MGAGRLLAELLLNTFKFVMSRGVPGVAGGAQRVAFEKGAGDRSVQTGERAAGSLQHRKPVVRTRAVDRVEYLLGVGVPRGPHAHRAGQLVYAAAGTLATTAERGTWAALAHRVTWTPPGFAHSHRFCSRTDARLLTVPVELCAELPEHPSVFAVGPLLREALLTLTGSRPEARPGVHQRLLSVVIDELSETLEQSLRLPEAADDRLRVVTELL
jgi:hypothetical protein